MSKKYERFLIELVDLCVEHGVQLSASNYDSIHVWDREPGELAIYSQIEDMTIEVGNEP